MTEPTTDPKTTTLSGKVRSMVSMTPAQLEDKGVPATVAQEKSENTAGGWAIALVGLAIVVSSGYIALVIVQGAREISVWVVILVAVVGAFGLAVFGLGMSMVSRRASPMMDKLGDWALKFVKAIRSPGGSAA